MAVCLALGLQLLPGASLVARLGTAAARMPTPPEGCAVMEGSHLVIAGQEVFPDVPLLAYHTGRMLVPIRIVADTLGADVGWDQAAKTAIVERAGRRILMPTGMMCAFIDGEPVNLDAPAVLYMDRTLVPLRFVAEALECQVGWDEDTRTATVNVVSGSPGQVLDVRVAVEEGRAFLKVDTDIALPYSAKTLDDPPRLVIDVAGAEPALAWSEKLVGQALVQRIRVQSLLAPSQVTRIVCDLDEPLRFEHRLASDGLGVIVELNYKVTGLAWEHDGLTIGTSGPPAWETFTLTAPDRFVIDVQNATLSHGGLQGVAVGAEDVVRVRVGQFQVNPDIVRVVLDLVRPAEFEVSWAGGGLRVLPAGAPPPECCLEYEETVEGGRFVACGIGGQAPSVSVTPDGRLLQVELPGFVANGETGGEVRDGVVSSYAVHARAAGGSILSIALEAYVGHEVIYDQGTDSVTLELERSVLVGKKICLDPGHGGRDPGCTSYSGIYECDVNWPITKALQERLERAGAQVKLTRGEHTSINAYGRVDVANAWRADVFVSIHCNAHTQSDKCGTEIWHYGNSSHSKRLAELISTRLRSLGLVDRGARVGNYAVLRETIMPAVLVETGFLTNPGDERVLLNPAKQAYIADLICQALVAYFR